MTMLPSSEMPRATLTRRVEVLEHTLGELAAVPPRLDIVERELAEFRAEVRQEFALVRADIRQGDEGTRRYMRILHEDLVARIATIGEAR